MEEKKKKNRISIWDVLLLAIFFGVVISFVFSMYYNDKLEIQLKERDVLIERLMKKDSLLNQVFELTYDSTGTQYSYSYRHRDGRILKYNELAKELDSAKIKNINIEVAKHKEINSLYQEIDDASESKNEIIEKYNSLIKQSNNYIDKLNQLSNTVHFKQDSISLFRSILKLINKNYGVTYSIKSKDGNRTISVESNRIDSALVLLPYYKHKIKKIEKTDSTITSIVSTDDTKSIPQKKK